MLTQKTVNTLGIISLALMLGLLLIVLFELVPRWLYQPLFFAAVGLFLVRMVLRFMLARQQKAEDASSDEPENQPNNPEGK